MNKKDYNEAIDLLKKEDVELIIKEIESNKLPVQYWKGGEPFHQKNGVELWSIDSMNMMDYLHFHNNMNLHWSIIANDLIKAIINNPYIPIHTKG